MPNQLFYGDNLEVMRRHIKDETVDLVYIDPPFNSNRDYFQIYNNIGGEDRAQAQAFTDTWTWDNNAGEGLSEIFNGKDGRFPVQTIELLRGLKAVLKEGALLAYIVSMTLRIVEIHRVLKSTGSFYLHCDPTASHYLKLILDSVFCSGGNKGDFRNEIVWYYYNKMHDRRKKLFPRATDTIFFYVKNRENFTFHQLKEMRDEPIKQLKRKKVDGIMKNVKGEDGKVVYTMKEDRTLDNVWRIPCLQPAAAERLGYPTQKPEALLERIIAASSNPGDVVLDAYCGCGTTIAVAQRLERQWIGIDITYQSIGVILKRLTDTYGKEIGAQVVLNGIPKDIQSARLLATKKDDRVRKEFEKWAVLTYSRHQAIINAKKGADGGVDGIQFFPVAFGSDEMGKVLYQVKSGGVGRRDIAQLRGDMLRENAQLGVFLTLEEPSGPMKTEAASAGTYDLALMGKKLPVITVATVQEIIEQNARLELPISHLVNKVAAAQKSVETQIALDLGSE